MNTFDKIIAALPEDKRILKEIDLKESPAQLDMKIFVWVNMPRRLLKKVGQGADEADSGIRFFGRLICVEDEGGEIRPLEIKEIDQLFDRDNAFSVWVIAKAIALYTEYRDGLEKKAETLLTN